MDIFGYNEYVYYGENGQKVEMEASIAAGYMAYLKTSKTLDDRKNLQNVLWCSGQWATMPRIASTNTLPTYRLANVSNGDLNTLATINNPKYIENLKEYTGKTEGPANFIAERANAWANIYYYILDANNNLNIKANQSNINVFVDQSTQSYIQGPYKLDLYNDGKVITKKKTNYYNGIELGNLVYREITKQNTGASKLPFIEYNGIKATIIYTDGTSESSNVELLDKDGNKITTCPNFGTEFYLNVKPKQNKAVKEIKCQLDFSYTKKLNGQFEVYRSQETKVELNNSKNMEETSGISTTFGLLADLTDSKTNSPDNRNILWKTNKTIQELADKYNVTNAQGLKNYLGNLIKAKSNEGKYKGYFNIEEIDLANDFYATKGSDGYWYYRWGTHNPIITENAESEGIYGDLAQSVAVPPPQVDSEKDKTSVELTGIDCTIKIGGHVWEDIRGTKEGKLNGRYKVNEDDKDIDYAGMLVTLLDSNGKQIAQTVTDEEGKYSFEGLNALKKYTIKFTYNGQIYQDTYYKEDLSGGFSNAKESVQDRENLNNRFTNISSYPNNYQGTAGWNSAYSLEEKIKDANGNYINYGSGLLTFNDVWNEFVARVLEYKSENDPHEYAYSDLSTWLEFENNIDKSEITKIKRFIYDCMINATVRQLPEKNQFYINSDKNASSITNAGKTFEPLYTNNYDMSQNVDFGIYKRETADLALQKDVYKATVRVNGKTHEYIYNKKDATVDDNGNWTIEVRKGDYLYNGTGSYTREIHKSDYLYDGSEIYGDTNADAKNLQVYITYRIAVRNMSALYDMSVNEIVDYYNNSQFEFKDDEITKNNTYIGTRTGERIGSVNIRNTSSLENNRENVSIPESSTLYITGINENGHITSILDENGNTRIQANAGMTYVYVTFKVKNEDNSSVSIENGRVKIDVSTEDGKANANSGKKRNASEINAYSSYYKENRNNDPALVPNTLDVNNNIQDEDVSGKNAGMLDMNSNPGNLRAEDFNKDGSLNLDRIENDTDQAPYVLLKFPEDPDNPENPDDSDERLFTGYVYEDERNQASDDAVIGDGIYNEGETPINGVTVQLVELVQEVNSEGTPTGKYLGEYVWNAIEVNENGNMTNTAHRYFSGLENETNRTEPAVISGPGILEISGFEVTKNGVYGFKGVPAGDFFIRFIYGDTTQTTLPNGGEVVTTLQSQATDETSGFISTTGLNAKSYNGQDYKSTIYQKNITQDTSYNKYNRVINGYKDYNNQNYEITNEGNQYLTDKPTKYSASSYVDRIASTTDGKDTSKMYYYDIAQSATISGASDAKDVGNIRTNSNNYSKGETGIDGVNEVQTLTNYRSEVLASPTKINSSGDVGTQINMLKELMDNTAMASQTGVINTEIEYNSDKTAGQGENNNVSYVLDGIDFGLVERPKAQLQMDKQVTNAKITLADGTILFDTNKSVDNMPYSKHTGHDIIYSNSIGGAYRLENVKTSQENTKNTTDTPELITTYMDEELMYGARIELTYDLKVINVGEVDYLDNQFYYKGETNNEGIDNISKTTAHTIVDYVSNNIQFLPNNSNNTGWSIRTVDQLTGGDQKDDLVNNKYQTVLNTYNAILTTKNLSAKNLVPSPDKPAENESSYTTTKLMLSTTLTPDSGEDSMVYNNLAEIVQVSNEQGRRMEFSIVGNQPMADQSLGTDVEAKPDQGIYTKADLVEPTEIDADSSQQVVILPPTGANKNYALWIGLGILVAIVIGGSIFLIKKKVLNNK